MSMNQLLQMRTRGQSPWLDGLAPDGELKHLLTSNALGGVVLSHASLREGITSSARYAELLSLHVPQDGGLPNLFTAYDEIAFDQARALAKELRRFSEPTHGDDGFVSIGLPPTFALLPDDTITEARRIYNAIGEPNIMIRIPAARPAGIAALRTLIAEGIPVDTTHVFDRSTYLEVIEAYIAGLEERAAGGHNLSTVTSIVSVPISPIDAYIDGRLEHLIKSEKLGVLSTRYRAFSQVKGLVAIAIAKLLYQEFLDNFTDARWESLVEKGAHVQRLHWTSTQPPTQPDFTATHYCDNLVAPDTVVSMSASTMVAFKRHGSLDKQTMRVSEARQVIETLEQLSGTSIGELSQLWLDEGLRSIDAEFDNLIHALASALTGLSARAT